MFRFIFPLVFLFLIASQIAYCQKKDLSFELETEVDYIFKDINQGQSISLRKKALAPRLPKAWSLSDFYRRIMEIPFQSVI